MSKKKDFQTVGYEDYPRFRSGDYEVRGMEDVVVNGRIVKKAVYRTVHPADNFKGMNANDFALENVIAAGALGSLRECQLSYNSVGETSDSVEGAVDNMITALNAAENNAEIKDEQ